MHNVVFFPMCYEFMMNEQYFRLLKYDDDMVLVGPLKETDPLCEAAYLDHTKSL